ncbi:ketopantoate reductase family protein [Halomonas sp. GD1P12]|uniref:ketopantoate reductase family protein n=1 Tax=Halomonas sp. GD1P12 TaxID=2982691 RepID=UPI0021E441C3|nr:2-dehydropantoate 2-reductase [Halomonas sp. GD1P12]UYG01500.1 2-dehydropantoate 2-reductase [Halomonas sp. GD1P12]
MNASHWILGPGAIGRLLAHSLAPTCEVTLIGRRALPLFQTLHSAKGERRTQSITCATPAQLTQGASAPPAWLHITTKAMAVEPAFETLHALLPATTPLVLWQNGFLTQPELTNRWPGPVLCASTTEGAYVTGNDRIDHAGRGHTFIGNLNGRHTALAQALAAQLDRAGLATTAVDDIRRRLWQKLAVNAAINPLVAIHGIRNGELRGAAYASDVEAVIREVAAIMALEKIVAPDGGDEQDSWRALVWDVIEGTANNKASMLQDVEAGRPTERAAILGPLIAAARQHGLTVPILEALDKALAKLEARY